MSEADSSEPATAFGHSVADTSTFLQALRGIFEERRADGENLAVLIVDCGVIGRIDAVWGYQIGDAVRNRVTASLRIDVLRPDDLVGELGRDDFACVLSTVEGPAVALLAAKKTLRALDMPFWIGEEEIYASPAIGIAMYPEHGDQAEVLLQRAKSACIRARDLPGRVADHGDDRDNSAASKLLYENHLRTAVSEDALELVFQPQYDLRRGQVMGAEGLLRWRDSALGLVGAEQAFAAADAADKVTDLVSSILNRALRNVSEFRYSAGLDLRIGVKLPARALRHPELLDVVQRALGTWSRRPGTLILGIGETSVLAEEPITRETLGRLKELGVKLSIDDPDMTIASLFGLASMPFQEIRIDVSAARDLAGAPKSEHILQSMIEMAHHLKLDVVAVGVVDDAAAARLKELGCDYMQADFKGPALDPQQFVERFGFNED
ncbi:MAG: EAL domain-containing protein [Sulfuritalea sp.]|nr:EAL domain-containing protein [Sulfuritalea sp.]MDP1982762.1 EAL domain-containing protein [Sulfuritalea sp.]